MDNLRMIQPTDVWYVIPTASPAIKSQQIVRLASWTTVCMCTWREQFVFKIVKLDFTKKIKTLPANLATMAVQVVMDQP